MTDATNPKTFSVRAVDAAQNVDDTPASYTWNVDSTGPTTTIASPAGTVGATSQLSFAAEPLASYRCRIDSGAPFTCAPGMATPSLAQGQHVVYVQGTDSVGNVGLEASQSFTVDLSPPTFTSFSAPADDGISDPITTVMYALSDGVVASCSIDGQTPSSGCTSPIALMGLAVGEHTFSITARDAVGNSMTLQRTWAVPPAANFQAADLVLGQNGDYTTNTANLGGVSGTSFDNVVSLDRNQSGMWMSDSNNCRVLFFAPVPILSTASALIALGQDSLTTNTCQMQGAQFPPNAVKLDLGSFVCTTSSRVYVSDVFSNRIMVWNLPVNVSGEPADLVLGQDDFVTKTRGNGADQLYNPFGMWCDDTRLIVADGGNNRVLIWTSAPTMNGEPADIVLGFSDFGMSGPAIPAPARGTMYTPYGVHYDGQRLYVVELSNHRVLVWNSLPSASGTPPSFVLGQASFTANAPGTGRDGLDQPRDVVTYKNSLLVSDRGNRRVVIWTPIPTATGERPRAVLGTADLDSTAPASGTEKVFFNGPRGLSIDGTKLFVADGNRVLRFQLRN